MNNHLFKPPQDPLSPSEEAEITKELAGAYHQHEISEKQPEFRRIAEKVKSDIATRSEKFPPYTSTKPQNNMKARPILQILAICLLLCSYNVSASGEWFLKSAQEKQQEAATNEVKKLSRVEGMLFKNISDLQEDLNTIFFWMKNNPEGSNADKGDTEKAQKAIDKMLSMMDAMPEYYKIWDGSIERKQIVSKIIATKARIMEKGNFSRYDLLAILDGFAELRDSYPHIK